MTNRNHHDMQIAVRASRSMLEKLDALVPHIHATRADAVRAAIDHYLYRIACEQDAERYLEAPLTEQELPPLDNSAGWAAIPEW